MAASFDAIIIGTGQAGPFLAVRLAEARMKVAVIERGLFGGTCVNTGCIPTKAMVASAYAAHMARRGPEYGVTLPGEVRVDMKKVKARKDAIQAPSRPGWRICSGPPRIALFTRHARFESAHEVSVGKERLTAPRIFINVGGRAAIPPLPGVNQVPFLTNSSMMHVDFLPRHLAIVGGSYIGLSLAKCFGALAARSRLLKWRSRLVPREDEDISRAIQDIVRNEGVNLRLNAKCISLAKRGDDVAVGVDCTQGSPEVNCFSRSAGGRDGGRIRMILGSKRLALRRTTTDTSGWTMNCAPMLRAFGPWATAMGKGGSRILLQRFRNCCRQFTG